MYGVQSGERNEGGVKGNHGVLSGADVTMGSLLVEGMVRQGAAEVTTG